MDFKSSWKNAARHYRSKWKNSRVFHNSSAAEATRLRGENAMIAKTSANLRLTLDKVMDERDWAHSRRIEADKDRDRLRSELRGALELIESLENALTESRNERDEARAENAALREALAWYVDNDDTNEGGKWEESNAGWLKGKRAAKKLLGRGGEE